MRRAWSGNAANSGASASNTLREELLNPGSGTLDGDVVKEHDGILTQVRSPRSEVAHYIAIKCAPSICRRSIDRSRNRLSASLS